jgi:hypothetical protein
MRRSATDTVEALSVTDESWPVRIAKGTAWTLVLILVLAVTAFGLLLWAFSY